MKIAIIGGGIAGLSAALALAGRGFEVEVFERHAAPTDIGAGIVCWPNASFVLQELGLLRSVAELSGRPARMRRVSRAGEELGALDIRKLDELMGYPSLSVLRKDLLSVLLSRVSEQGIRVQYGHVADRIEPSATGSATVHFASGATASADVILGAEGRMNSIARKFVHGDNRPRYQGFINWIGTFTSPRAVFSEIEVKDYWGVGARFGVVPVSDARAYWAGAAACPEIQGKAPADYHDELRALFRGWPSPIPQLIEETPAERINKIYVHDHDPIDTWHRDNVLLIGDAAHAALPTSGQGACQALEDAWHLADCLGGATSLGAAFTEFTQRRRGKNAAIVAGARNLARSLFATDPALCEERDRNSKSTDYEAMAHGMARGWGSGLPMSEDPAAA
ncbi:FAD-dependent oxidoreductase [Sorangium sp. So ce1078]|uniref:FAD-dependent oxidoreductase n=1 Tax=Sorangium sp. So ce1078 TaxID=3133329 RepID=UPI003F63CD5B